MYRRLFLFGSLVVFTISAPSVQAEDLFPDKKLDGVVRKYVFEKRDNDKPLTKEDVATISTIQAKNAGITNLAGLEHCRSLALLTLSGNQISALKPIAGLEKLQSLTLKNNKISDLSPLAKLTRLQYLDLSGNEISDLKPVAELVAMRSLYLSNNKIADLSSLVNLKHLWSLYADHNHITDLTPIAQLTWLSSLDLRSNKLKNVAPLKNLKDLKHLLLDENQIADLTVLVEMCVQDRQGPKQFAPYLNIYLKGNPLSDPAKNQQLPKLRESVRRAEF